MKRNILKPLLICSALFATGAANAQQPENMGFGGFQFREVKLENADKIADVNYAGDDQAYHNCDIYIPKNAQKPYPVVVHIYGSAWFSNSSKGMADISTIVKALVDAGYAVVTPNHRSSMDAKYPAQINDIKAVIRFVRGEADKYGFDPRFIATSGFSSGGHLASLAATTKNTKQGKSGSVTVDLEGSVGKYTNMSSNVDAACDWSGPIDLMNMDCGGKRGEGASGPEEALLGAKASENPDLYNLLTPIYYIDKNDPPLIVFHGKEDNVVPCCQGQELYDHLKAAGVKTDLTLVDGGGHGMNMYSEANLQKMVNFLNAAKAARITNNGNVNGNGNANGQSKEKVNGNDKEKTNGNSTNKGKTKVNGNSGATDKNNGQKSQGSTNKGKKIKKK